MKTFATRGCLALALITSLAWFVLCATSKAVTPTPDGGYPGYNTAEGQNALFSLTTGFANTAVGWFSLKSSAQNSFNTAVGAGTLPLNTADENTAVGAAALLLNATGFENVAVGFKALFSNSTGPYNTAIGNSALLSNTTGDDNTAIGWSALSSNTTGVVNTAIGESALHNNITGSANTAIGDYAGSEQTGSGNVSIGAGVPGLAGENNVTRIRNIGSTPIVGGINVVVAGTSGIGDQILGYASSSRRYKQEIKPMDKASEALFALRPVTFRAKDSIQAHRAKHYGLIAEDVATVDPDLVVYNPDGKPATLRFDSINAMLLNEFLKEHKTVEEQQANITQLNSKMASQAAIVAQQRKDFEAAIAQQKKDSEATAARQQKEIQVLTAQLKEQLAQIQKVSAHIELIKPAPRVTAHGK